MKSSDTEIFADGTTLLISTEKYCSLDHKVDSLNKMATSRFSENKILLNNYKTNIVDCP